jgi:hypothetical protein
MAHLLALVLLNSPVDMPISEEVFRMILPHLRQIAIDQEILGPQENCLVNHRNYQDDIRLIRARVGMLKDCPSIADSYRYPPKEIIWEMKIANSKYQRFVEHRLATNPQEWWELDQILQETRLIHRLWDLAYNARSESLAMSYRREALREIRNLIGPEAYYEGYLPPCVPVWRLQPID